METEELNQGLAEELRRHLNRYSERLTMLHEKRGVLTARIRDLQKEVDRLESLIKRGEKLRDSVGELGEPEGGS